jgi:phosphate acetyltransferase
MATSKDQVFETLADAARRRLCRIALPEAGVDARVLHAAVAAADAQLAVPVLVGPASEIHALAQSEQLDVSSCEIVEPSADAGEAAAVYRQKRAGREEVSDEQARAIAADPLYFAALQLADARCDGLVAGATRTTADVVRAAIRCVGTRPGIKTVSSFFLMILPESSPMGAATLLFADCGVVAEPNVEQLADIAITTAEVGGQLFGLEPRIAMLSFSTRGSAQHALVNKVREATRLVQERRPDLPCDGEMQLDAALVADVAQRKAPGSSVAGRANVLIFPDLDSGNIGYKLTQRGADAVAIGPVLQGLARPVSDLSRGCSVQDVVDAITLTAAQANLAAGI